MKYREWHCKPPWALQSTMPDEPPTPYPNSFNPLPVSPLCDVFHSLLCQVLRPGSPASLTPGVFRSETSSIAQALDPQGPQPQQAQLLSTLSLRNMQSGPMISASELVLGQVETAFSNNISCSHGG